jgi:hypothetical protein
MEKNTKGPSTNRSMDLDSLVPEESKRNIVRNLNNKNNSKLTTKEESKGSNDLTIQQNDVLNNEEMDDLVNPIIFVRGVPTDSFYMILSGKVMICSGNEGFLLE